MSSKERETWINILFLWRIRIQLKGPRKRQFLQWRPKLSSHKRAERGRLIGTSAKQNWPKLDYLKPVNLRACLESMTNGWNIWSGRCIQKIQTMLGNERRSLDWVGSIWICDEKPETTYRWFITREDAVGKIGNVGLVDCLKSFPKYDRDSHTLWSILRLLPYE